MEKDERYKGKLQALIDATNEELDLTKRDLEEGLRRLKNEEAINEAAQTILSAYTDQISSTDDEGFITLSKRVKIWIYNLLTSEEKVDYNVRWQASQRREKVGENIRNKIFEKMEKRNREIESVLKDITQMDFEIIMEKVELVFEYGHYGRRDETGIDCIQFTKSYYEVMVNLK